MGFYRRRVVPHMINLFMKNRETTRFRRMLVPRAAGRVIEIGVGSGHNLGFYGAAVETVQGVDPSPELLRMAARRAAPVPVELVEAGAEALPFDDASFDSAVMTWTLCSIPEPEAALGEIRRVMKPTARLVFVEHGRADTARLRAWQDRLNPLWRWFTGGCNLNRRMDALIEGAGFAFDSLDTGFVKGPKIAAFQYWGEARVR